LPKGNDAYRTTALTKVRFIGNVCTAALGGKYSTNNWQNCKTKAGTFYKGPAFVSGAIVIFYQLLW
jgi:hypothetical protein